MADRARRRKSPSFVMIYQSWLQAPAWSELSGNERATFVEVLRRYTGDNNGAIVFSERQAAKAVGVSRATARKSLHRLESIGWIRPTIRGHFDQKGIATTWRVTVWPAFGKAASHNYLKWTPEQKA